MHAAALALVEIWSFKERSDPRVILGESKIKFEKIFQSLQLRSKFRENRQCKSEKNLTIHKKSTTMGLNLWEGHFIKYYIVIGNTYVKNFKKIDF